jgi:hypothetical protein
MQRSTRRKVERRGSWLVVGLLAVLLVIAALWLIYPIRLL